MNHLHDTLLLGKMDLQDLHSDNIFAPKTKNLTFITVQKQKGNDTRIAVDESKSKINHLLGALNVRKGKCCQNLI